MNDTLFEQAPELDFSARDRTLSWFRDKTMMPAEEFYQLEARARAKAFTVSNVMNLDLVSEVWRTIDRSIRDGLTFDQFVDAVGTKLASEWRWNEGPRRGPDIMNRLDTIFRTNLQSAFSAGRYTYNNRPEVKATHPFSRFSAVMDDRTTDECEALDGTILPTDDPFWASHQPPLHFNCRSDVTALTAEEAKEEGTDDQAPDVEREDPDFGNPLDSYEPDLSTRPAELANLYELKVQEGPHAEPPTPAPEPEEPEGLELELNKHETKMVDRETELGVILDENGKTLLAKEGNRSSVAFSLNELLLMKDKVLTHNHPSGSTLSPADVRMASDHNLREVRAVGRIFGTGEPVVYRLIRPGSSESLFPGNNWPSSQAFTQVHNESLRWVRNNPDPFLRDWFSLGAEAYQAKYSKADDWKASYSIGHLALERTARALNLDYRVERLKNDPQGDHPSKPANISPNEMAQLDQKENRKLSRKKR